MPLATSAGPSNVHFVGLKNRKFGRQDLQEHYEISQDAVIGSSEIEGVYIDCRFIFSKTQLGILEDVAQPGGIIYMELTVNQPVDWTVTEASVSVILEDPPDPTVRLWKREAPKSGNVQMVAGCYGPKDLKGPDTVEEATRDWNFAPQVEAMGFGATLGGVGRSVSGPRSSWWNFRGTLKPASTSSLQYTKLCWTMSPSAFAQLVDHPPKIQTAFTFSHRYKPFLLRVEIDGKLRHKRDKYKDKTIGLFSKEKRKNPIMLLFKFDPHTYPDARILSQAKDLEDEMARLAHQTKQIMVDHRIAATDYFDSKGPTPGQNARLNPPKSEVKEAAEDPKSIPDQNDLMVRLQNSRNALLADKTAIPVPEYTLVPNYGEDAVKTSDSVQEVSRGATEASQQMPASSWWIVTIWIRMLHALLLASERQQKQ